MSVTNQVGLRQTVEVLKQLPIGLLVALPDGRKGIVREREIAWETDELADWRKRLTRGVKFDAVVVRVDGGQLELSRRLAQADPWQSAAVDFAVGGLVRGVVSGLDEGGVFIELAPGVTGKLHVSQLPAWCDRALEELFWRGDHVYATVLRVDNAARTIDLSLDDLLAQRWQSQEYTLATLPLTTHTPVASSVLADDTLPLDAIQRHGVRSILVVEDDPQQNDALCGRFAQAGHQVQGALDGETALDALRSGSFDILLSDVGLPRMDGLELMRRAAAEHPHLRIFAMTDWISADQRSAEIAALGEQGVRLLLKPLAVEDLWNIASSELPAHFVRKNGLATAPASSHPPSTQGRLRSALDEVRKLTRASQAMLFRLDHERRLIEVVHAVGGGRLAHEQAVHLIHSPVREVCEERTLVRIDDSDDPRRERYLHHLRGFVSFRSALGTPVPCALSDGYALFVFGVRPSTFNDMSERLVRAAGIAIGAMLQEERTLAQMAEMQRTLLLGHLARALVHEVNHQLTPLVFALEELQGQCRRVSAELEQPNGNPQREMAQTQGALSSLSASLNALIKTTKLFGRITVQDDVRIVRIDRVLEQCITLLKDTADRTHVKIVCAPASTVLFTRTKETLVQQILLNLLLNAVQQIGLTRAAGGQVYVRMEKFTQEERPLIRIVIEDDGPGIHRALWQRIFDLGMTTRREDGSGMGLYLVDRLCSELQGRVRVNESAMLWGTRFVVELPVVL